MYKRSTNFALLGAYATSRKAVISFVISVCPSACQHGTTRLSMEGFRWNLIFDKFFWKPVGKIWVWLNSDKNDATLHKDQRKFLIISRSILLRTINFSDKVVEKIKTHILCLVTFFPPRKSWRLRDNAEIYSRDKMVTDDNRIWRMCVICWPNKATNTHS
jgi:hypothetical protein